MVTSVWAQAAMRALFQPGNLADGYCAADLLLMQLIILWLSLSAASPGVTLLLPVF
jgi:hypothetical protein